MRRLEEERLRLEAVELLRILRRSGVSYGELEEATGVPRSSLSLYVSGQRLPGPGVAAGLLEALLSSRLTRGLLAARLRGVGSMADLGDAVLDPLVLRYASIWAGHMFRGRVDVVVSAETYGIPVATAVALSLDARLVVARREAGSPSRSYIRAVGGDPPFGVKVLYLPRDMLRTGDRVLLVDDVARTGATLEALARGAAAAGAVPEAAMVLIGVGVEWRARLERLGVSEAYALTEIA